MRISDWSSDVCSSDLNATATIGRMNEPVHAAGDGPITDGLITGATLVTLDGDAGYGVVADGTLAWRDGVIRFAGPRAELPAELAGDAIDVGGDCITPGLVDRSEEHTSELQSLMRISYAVFCLNKKILSLKHYDT